MSNVIRLRLAAHAAPDDTAEVAQSRRNELGNFLRTRRAALTPAEVNVVPIGRRHVKGLRREEVAGLAGIGTSWYTLLEQGRVTTVSEGTLARIATALRVSPAEKEHLLALARNSFHRDVFELEPGEATVAFVDRFDVGPAILITAAFDVVAANALADELYQFPATAASRWNLIEHLLADTRLQAIFPRWEETARSMTSVLRGNSSRFGGRAFAETIARLRAASPRFESLWNSHDVSAIPSELCEVDHPRLGFMTMQLHALVHADSPAHTIVCLTQTLRAVS